MKTTLNFEAAKLGSHPWIVPLESLYWFVHWPQAFHGQAHAERSAFGTVCLSSAMAALISLVTCASSWAGVSEVVFVMVFRSRPVPMVVVVLIWPRQV